MMRNSARRRLSSFTLIVFDKSSLLPARTEFVLFVSFIESGMKLKAIAKE